MSFADGLRKRRWTARHDLERLLRRQVQPATVDRLLSTLDRTIREGGPVEALRSLSAAVPSGVPPSEDPVALALARAAVPYINARTAQLRWNRTTMTALRTMAAPLAIPRIIRLRELIALIRSRATELLAGARARIQALPPAAVTGPLLPAGSAISPASLDRGLANDVHGRPAVPTDAQLDRSGLSH